MWLAKTMANRTEKTHAAQTPETKILCAKMGEEYAVGAFEYRDLPVCGAYGVFSRAPQGTEVAVLATAAGDLCMGAITEQSLFPAMQPGEILLRAKSGATIKLCEDGAILLNGFRIAPDGQGL